MGISPKRILGNWDDGYRLDVHTESSTPIGEDDFGHMQFNTIRTELGELLYQVKYKHNYQKIQEIINIIQNFIVSTFYGTVDCVLPIPPTKKRAVQHVEIIAERIAMLLNCTYSNSVLTNESDGEAKDNQCQRKITQLAFASSMHNVLLVDDITSTGKTANACVNALRKDPNISKIYFLTLTVRRNPLRR